MVEKAQDNYNTVLEYLDSESSLEGEEQVKRNALVLAARLNLAACQLKIGDNSKVIEHCNEALDIQGDSTKAFFRRGQVSFTRISQVLGCSLIIGRGSRRFWLQAHFRPS